MGLALLTLLTVLAAEAPAPRPADALMAEAETMLLEGRPLPRDMRLRLLALEPDERIQVIAYLRRIGLMKGAAWPAGDLLMPATATREGE